MCLEHYNRWVYAHTPLLVQKDHYQLLCTKTKKCHHFINFCRKDWDSLRIRSSRLRSQVGVRVRLQSYDILLTYPYLIHFINIIEPIIYLLKFKIYSYTPSLISKEGNLSFFFFFPSTQLSRQIDAKYRAKIWCFCNDVLISTPRKLRMMKM